jgi:hypothetical protein
MPLYALGCTIDLHFLIFICNDSVDSVCRFDLENYERTHQHNKIGMRTRHANCRAGKMVAAWASWILHEICNLIVFLNTLTSIELTTPWENIWRSILCRKCARRNRGIGCAFKSHPALRPANLTVELSHGSKAIIWWERCTRGHSRLQSTDKISREGTQKG